jgi:hypothetical protein
MLSEADVTRLEQIDEDIENENMGAYGLADLIWMRDLLRQVIMERDIALDRVAAQARQIAGLPPMKKSGK